MCVFVNPPQSPRQSICPWATARAPVPVKVAMTLKHNASAKLLEPSHPMVTVRSGIGIPINLNGRPSKRMVIFGRSNCDGNFSHLNESAEVSGPFHPHRHPLSPNRLGSMLFHGRSRVSSWLVLRIRLSKLQVRPHALHMLQMRRRRNTLE